MLKVMSEKLKKLQKFQVSLLSSQCIRVRVFSLLSQIHCTVEHPSMTTSQDIKITLPCEKRGRSMLEPLRNGQLL